MAKIVRMLTATANGSRRCSMPLPKEISQHLPDKQLFNVSMTDDGILYKPVEGETAAEDEVAPKWARQLSKKRAAQKDEEE